jgi:hypothetical protein
MSVKNYWIKLMNCQPELVEGGFIGYTGLDMLTLTAS